MNRLTKHILAFCLIMATFSIQAQSWWGKGVRGNGNITTQTRSTQDYDQVTMAGPMDVKLVRGTEGKITVTADENLQQYIIVETRGDELVIKIEKGINLRTSRHGIKITVPFKGLNHVSLTGSGDIFSTDLIKGDRFKTSITGSGDMVLRVENNSMTARITGSGDMDISGKTNNLDMSITGSGDFDGSNLESVNTTVSVTGSGDADVHCSGDLKARVSGSGDISYQGHPKTQNTKVSGSGSISSN